MSPRVVLPGITKAALEHLLQTLLSKQRRQRRKKRKAASKETTR
jgi:hypothetical protein